MPHRENTITVNVEHIGHNTLVHGPSAGVATPKGDLWRLCQRGLAAIAILCLSPLLIVFYPIVRLTSPGPFFYTQLRPGRDGAPFRAFKVRTMYLGADCDRSSARSVKANDPRVTRIGRILRELKLDELPQLYNVLRGEMELVGPRPIAISFQEELESKIPGFSARLSVAPGLTSLPQICVLESDDPHRVVEDWARRFEMERHYIRYKSARYDCIIIGLTLAFLARKVWLLLRQCFVRRGQHPSSLALALMLMCVAGCQATPEPYGPAILNVAANSATTEAAASDALTIKNLKAEPIQFEQPEPEYRVGPGDVLKINIFGEVGMNDLSVVVDTEGRIQLPAVPSQLVNGLTLTEIQTRLAEAYQSEFNDPWVMVSMDRYGSRPLYLLGEFNSPGITYMRGPTNVLNAIGMANGTNSKAYLRGARVFRQSTVLPVDLNAVLKEGKLDHNIWLKGGDTIFVPNADDLKVYILGAVKNPGAIPLVNGKTTLVRALSEAGGPLPATANTEKIRIIRALSAMEGQIIDIDAERVLRGDTLDFGLLPDDIVYVAQTALADWNDFVEQLLPTMNLIGAAVQPFMVL